MSDLENKTSTTESQGNTYWQDVENKVLDKEFLKAEFQDGEFDAMKSVSKDRRSFLKIMGFSVSALPLTGCIKIPVKKALPYLNKQDDVIPGVANWYSSTFDNIPVLVKTREGRPIKIEGNDKSKTTMGGTSARAQASVLSLYDSHRLKSASVDGKSVEWNEFDKALKDALAGNAGKVAIVTRSSSSPSENKLVAQFASKYNATHIAYDSVSNAGIAAANEITHGSNSLSEYNFENANVVVSFGADFLGTWGNSVANAKQFAKRRDVTHANGMNRHYHIEHTMSLTGSNADYRYTKSYADQKIILLGVYSSLSGSSYTINNDNAQIVNKIVSDLQGNKGKSLVVCGCNDTSMQVLVNKINSLLNNYGQTVNVYKKSFNKQANDTDFMALVDQMNAGSYGAVFFVDVNPVYDFYDTEKVKAAMGKTPITVAMTLHKNETANASKFVAPINHTYESWSDSMVAHNEISFTQPVIQPLFGTRMWTETLMSVAGMKGSFYDYLKAFWNAQGLNWNQALHDGVATVSSMASVASEKSYSVSSHVNNLKAHKAGKGLNIVTYTKYGIGAGDMTNNPWLQELPDPVTKATWDNYALISPSYAKENNLKSGHVVEVSNGKRSVKLPVVVQPGTDKNTVAIALGYGQKTAGKVANGLGVNAFGFVTAENNFQYCDSYGTVKATGKFSPIAQTQTHHSMEGRDIVRETTFSQFQADPKAGNRVKKPKTVHIYPSHKKDGHQWAMSVDLTKCTGCSSCIVSCSAENNVPVVGKQEVINRREMHWLRLDRYYSGEENQPQTVHMPMLCQHCENAPCENVCPVMATLHSNDGLNQQVYNRCVGTRYCANNCPYKVRRFNWFNYEQESDIERMVLNPDVSIRKRGIMEKCSMCVQRIQEGKLTAKKERRALKDGDIKVACQQSCPSDAIVFGDINDPKTKISQVVSMDWANKYKNDRGYEVLEELNVQPRVSYLTKIRNK